MDLLISMAVNVVLETVKDPKKKRQIQRAMFKVFRALCDNYKDEREFRDYAKFTFTELEV